MKCLVTKGNKLLLPMNSVSVFSTWSLAENNLPKKQGKYLVAIDGEEDTYRVQEARFSLITIGEDKAPFWDGIPKGAKIVYWSEIPLAPPKVNPSGVPSDIIKIASQKLKSDTPYLNVFRINAYFNDLELNEPDKSVVEQRNECLDWYIKDLDKRMRDFGLISIADAIQNHPAGIFGAHAGVHDLESFKEWLEMRQCEIMRMNAEFVLHRDNQSDMYEWSVSHSAMLAEVLANMKQAGILIS